MTPVVLLVRTRFCKPVGSTSQQNSCWAIWFIVIDLQTVERRPPEKVCSGALGGAKHTAVSELQLGWRNWLAIRAVEISKDRANSRKPLSRKPRSGLFATSCTPSWRPSGCGRKGRHYPQADRQNTTAALRRMTVHIEIITGGFQFPVC